MNSTRQEVKSAVFETKDGTYYLNPKDEMKYFYEADYHGDHDECWIKVEVNNRVIAQHNVKYCVSILWEEQQ